MYQKTNAMSEIKRVNKDNFWAKAEVSEQVPQSTKCLDLAGDYSPYAYSLSGNWGILPGIGDLELREAQSCYLGVPREEGLSLEGEGAPLPHLNLAQGERAGMHPSSHWMAGMHPGSPGRQLGCIPAPNRPHLGEETGS